MQESSSSECIRTFRSQQEEHASCSTSKSQDRTKLHHYRHHRRRSSSKHLPADGSPNCPICLSYIRKSDLAVLRHCMHRFCVVCIEKWSLLQRFCPLCKQNFQGWCYNIRSSSVYDVKRLKPLSARETSPDQRRTERQSVSRIVRRHSVNSERRSQPLPWVRSFRSPYDNSRHGSESDRALKWRVSIYRNGLRAVQPLLDKKVVCINQVPANDPERRSRIQKRLEPWIHRELTAILGHGDHSILVHLVVSLWLNVLLHDEKRGNSNAGIDEVEAIRQLTPFLDDQAAPFWHELKCFAESPFSLGAYDSVVKYLRACNV